MYAGGALRADDVLTPARAWQLVQALARAAGAGRPVLQACGAHLDGRGELAQTEARRGLLDLYPDPPGGDPWFRSPVQLAPEVEEMLTLFLPLCMGVDSADLVLGHVGQSLDGQIATASGASCFITGEQDVLHTHRLRALCDAVLIGRATVAFDDPRLTTRLVAGRSPTRVVIDPGLHAAGDRKVFRDGVAATLLLCARGVGQGRRRLGQAEIVEIPAAGSILPPQRILRELRRLGLRRIFVEGGGVTVSHFLRAGLLRRLHLAISPVFLGQGRPGVALPAIAGLEGALRPRVRRFSLGDDILFDCEFPPGGG